MIIESLSARATHKIFFHNEKENVRIHKDFGHQKKKKSLKNVNKFHFITLSSNHRPIALCIAFSKAKNSLRRGCA